MNKHNIFWGLILLLGGMAIIAYGMGFYITFPFFLFFLTIILGGVSIKNLFRYNFVGVFLPLAIILMLWRRFLGINTRSSFIFIFGAIILGIAFSLLFSPLKKQKYFSKQNNMSENAYSSVNFQSNTANTNEHEFVSIEVNFGEHTRFLQSTNLKNIKAGCNFGTIKLYLDQATLAPEGLTLNVDCNFGSIIVYVPHHWSIEDRTHGFLGSVTNAHSKISDFPPVRLVGDINFASVQIVYL